MCIICASLIVFVTVVLGPINKGILEPNVTTTLITFVGVEDTPLYICSVVSGEGGD